MCIENLLSQPDAIAFRRGREIDQYLNFYNVPFAFFRGSIQPENFIDSGSGVLVKLAKRFFVLTAGHCVTPASAQDANVLFVISTQTTRFNPKIARHACVSDNDYADFGYFEIHPIDAREMEIRKKIFKNAEGLYVRSSVQLQAENDWMIVSGYPALLKQEELSDIDRVGTYFQHYLVLSRISGNDSAPPSPLPPSPIGIDVSDVWIPRRGLIDITSGGFQEIDLHQLRGMSGGGFWKTNVRPNTETWNENEMMITGTHFGSRFDVRIEGDDHVFAREVLISNHLRLLADDYPDLRQEIMDRWGAQLGQNSQ
jgi:hypothetical protein